jgi:glycosyltransferase involved in cell wall biosynthesis
MTEASVHQIAGAGDTVQVATGRAVLATWRRRVVLVQTQAEAAGAQEISRILGRGLEAKGYEVHHVFFFRRTDAFDHVPNTFFCMGHRPNGIQSVSQMLFRLVRHLQKLRPDVVLCFQHYGNLIGAAAARIAGARTVIANRTSAKSLLPWWFRCIDLMWGSAGLFSNVVVNSKPVEDEYRGYPRRYRSRVLRIDHGFETKCSCLGKDEARKSFGLPTGITLLGSAARLHPGKNLSAAIRLLTFDCDWHLALVGQGSEGDNLVRLARALGVLHRVHFLGELPFDRIGTFLRSLDVFVFPSLAETFGLAAVEAAQAGVPVVANDLEILREVLAVDGEPCAAFVNACDPDAFANVVRTVLADKEARAVLISRARSLADRYSLDAMIRQYADLIEIASVLSGKNGHQ